MEVILLERVTNLGNIGDKVKVKAGYARNYLLPKSKAIAATEANLAQFEEKRAELEAKAAEVLAAAKSRAEVFASLAVNVPMRAGDDGKLFGSVGVREIVHAVQTAGEEIDKSEVLMPEGPIHTLGEFEVDLQLHPDVVTTIKIQVIEEK